ncbi:MAG: hypothetical protein IT320_26265 [Anaerolineae bacterium]|nr:hypothetical protein [Anaerolineae bacterium]
MSILGLVSFVIIMWRPKLALPVVFGWIAVVDLLKRLLWYDPNQSIPSLLYQIVLIIPDALLIAAALRTAFNVFVSRTWRFKPNLVDALVGLFLVWSVLNIFNPKLDSLYLGVVGFRSANLYILTYFLARSIPKDALPTLLRQLAIVIAAGTLLAVVYTFIQLQVGLHPFELRWLTSGETVVANQDQVQGLFGTFRPFATFSNHEQLGWWLGTAIAFLPALVGPLWLYLVIAAPAAFIIIRTLSRSSWLFTGASLGLMFLFSLFTRSWRQSARSLLIVVALAASFFAWTRLGDSLLTADTSEIIDTIESTIETNATGTATPGQPRPTPGAPGRTTIEDVEQQNADAFTARATTTGTIEWRIYTVQALIGDPSWRTLLGNGMGSMWYAARFNIEGAILPSSVEVRQVGVLGLPPGKRILSHIGLVDTVYELGIVGLTLFLAASITAIVSAARRLFAATYPQARNIGFSFVALLVAIMLVNASFANTLTNARSVAVVFWGVLGLLIAVSLNTELFAAARDRTQQP